MADLQLRVIRELRRTGIRIVKLSGTSSAITPDGPYACREHWEVERVLRRQRPAVRHPAAELVHAGARRPADDVGTARDRHRRQPDRRSGHQPHRRPRRRCGRGARADPSRLGRADPGPDRTAAARLRRTRRAGVCSHRRGRDRRSMSPSIRYVLRSSVAAWRSGKPTTSARCTNCSGPANRSSSPTRCARSPGAAPRTIEAYLDELVAPQQVLV